MTEVSKSKFVSKYLESMNTLTIKQRDILSDDLPNGSAFLGHSRFSEIKFPFSRISYLISYFDEGRLGVLGNGRT